MTNIERIYNRLPEQIKNSDVLNLYSKKVLAALLELQLHSEAKESGIVIASNGTLRKLSSLRANSIMDGIRELIDFGLIQRLKGKPRRKGEKATASEYIINFENLKKPIVEKTFDELFADFYKTPETSMGTAIPIAIATPIPTKTSTKTTIKTTTSTLTSTETTNGITCNNILYNNNPLKEKDNLINNSINSNNIVTDYVNKQLEGKTTYSELVKQFTPIHQWIFSNWSNDNAERLVTVANKLINERLKKFEAIKTETVDVDSCQSV